MDSLESVAYLRGLADGVGLDSKDKKDKVIIAIIDALAVITEELADLNADSMELAEELDLLSDSVAALEDFCDECCEDDDDDDECDCEECCDDGYFGGKFFEDWDDDADVIDISGHGHHHGHAHEHSHEHEHSHDHQHEDGEECDCDDCSDEELFYSVTCPSCNKEITVDGDILEQGSIACPNCGEMLEFEFDGVEEDE